MADVLWRGWSARDAKKWEFDNYPQLSGIARVRNYEGRTPAGRALTVQLIYLHADGDRGRPLGEDPEGGRRAARAWVARAYDFDAVKACFDGVAVALAGFAGLDELFSRRLVHRLKAPGQEHEPRTRERGIDVDVRCLKYAARGFEVANYARPEQVSLPLSRYLGRPVHVVVPGLASVAALVAAGMRVVFHVICAGGRAMPYVGTWDAAGGEFRDFQPAPGAPGEPAAEDDLAPFLRLY
jgi:hypothetical protein